MECLAVCRNGHSFSVTSTSPCPKRSLSTPTHETQPRHWRLAAKANGVTTRRVGNTGGKRSHASRTSGCPGELSSTSSAQPFIYLCRHPNCRQERRLDATPHRQRCLCLDFVGIGFRPEFRLRRLIDAETVAVFPLLLGNHRQWNEVWLRHQLPREVPSVGRV